MKIYEYIYVPSIVRSDKEQIFIWKQICNHEFLILPGKFRHQLGDNQIFLRLRRNKVQVKFLKNDNLFIIFSLNYTSCEDILKRIYVYDYNGFPK